MKTTVLVFHPNWDQSRVNKALANGLDQQIEVRNMYQLYPDFKIDIEKEHQVLDRNLLPIHVGQLSRVR